MTAPEAGPNTEVRLVPQVDRHADRRPVVRLHPAAGRPSGSVQELDDAPEEFGTLLPEHPGRAGAPMDRDWVVRAQDGEAAQVLAEIERIDSSGLEPRGRGRALYAQALCLMMLGRGQTAIAVVRELCQLCRDLRLEAAGLQARALLVDLLRSEGEVEQAVEQLAHAVALEPALRDLSDPDTQAALGALAIALRHSGAAEEAVRISRRLAAVERRLSLHQRVSRWSNLAFEHVAQAVAVARRAPYEVNSVLLNRAVVEIEYAARLATDGTYQVVRVEAAVISALPAAMTGDAQDGLTRLQACRELQERGAEATSAQIFWAVGTVRALVRLGRMAEAATIGARALSRARDHGSSGDRMILAYEVMRAENPQVERSLTGTAEYLALTEERVGTSFALVSALFRARVDLLRGADERRVLARAASLDLLTGLVNRRGGASAIAEAAARPPGEPVALLLIDLDGFKDVNDTCGHLAGDVVLQQVSGALRAAARVEDVVARWGGDEFVVVAALDEDRAVALADRLRETIRQRTGEAVAQAVTGSIGIAVRETPLDEESWLQRADDAMYTAKRTGGDATMLG